jgi:hypothetical protein
MPASDGALYWQNITTASFYLSDGITSVGNIMLDVSRVVPTAHENRPASISALACISY